MSETLRCRICKGEEFTDVLDLGMTPYADDFLTEERLRQPEMWLPLKMVICDQCHLVQLTYVAPREALYQNDYPYVSSTTDMGVQHYYSMADEIVNRFHLNSGCLAVDIGSNVGVLAEGFKRRGLKVLGIEPAPKIAHTANLRGIETINEFFSADLAEQIVASRGFASVVTGTNVVAHIDDLHDLALGLCRLLEPNGVFVFEAPYLGDLLSGCEYDTIYHEHLSYLSIKPIQAWCDRFELEVFHVERQRIHGGTLRYFISLAGTHPVDPLVTQMAEAEGGMYTGASLHGFAASVTRNREDLNSLLYQLKRGGNHIAAVSAPAKGMTLLNYCGIGSAVLDFVTEKAPLKIGRYTPGTHLPVVPDAVLIERQPDYALLLAWNFAEEIIRNLKDFRGRFIIPIPSPVVVG